MKFYQKLDGGVHVSAREYNIAASVPVSEGQAVKLIGGLVAPASATETGALLGVAAENHSGVADALDSRADGGKILVIDDPAAVYRCAAPRVTATGGTGTTLVAAGIAAFTNDDFIGGCVKLVSKAAGSTNADKIGTVRIIADFTATDRTFTLADGGTPCAGDIYAVFPPVGFAKGIFNTARTGIALSATVNLPLRVIGADTALDQINVMVKKHIFAVSA